MPSVRQIKINNPPRVGSRLDSYLTDILLPEENEIVITDTRRTTDLKNVLFVAEGERGSDWVMVG